MSDTHIFWPKVHTIFVVTALAVSATLLSLGALPATAEEPGDAATWIDKNGDSLVDLYKQLHQAPELSLKEEQTAKRMAEELRAVGATVTTDVGGHGVVGVIQNGSGKVLMLRADMDGLPVIEQTGLPYASQVRIKDDRGATVGVMHACGHDMHMTNMVGVARYLASHRGQWSGTLVIIFQPAEERGGGAKAMLDDGLFVKFPRPDYAVALHCGADFPIGQVGYRAGYIQANVDSVDITVKGRGGHGAYPHMTIDPIVIAARLIVDLQSIVSREINPTEPAVITVGSIHGGAKHNIISDECRLQLTVRSYSPEVRQKLLDGIKRKALTAAASSGASEPEVSISESTPSLKNDPELTERIASALRRTLGDANVVESERSMGGEDFSYYGLAGVPVCMFKLGTVKPELLAEFAARNELAPSLHSPLYYPDPAGSLKTGVPAMVSIVLDLLAPGKSSGKK
jgi:amidohydrolase